MTTAASSTRQDYIRRVRANVPAHLRGLPQWVCWRYELRDGKSTKVPYNPRTGGGAQSNNADTWTTLDDAITAYEESAQSESPYDGVGFMFAPGGGIVGIDCDNAFDAYGHLRDWVQRVLDRVDSYAEYSPSRPSAGKSGWSTA